MGSTPEELKTKYSEILTANGIKDEISNVTITKPDLKGMHMGSIIETAQIDFTSGRDPLHLFLKKRLQMAVPEMDEGFRDIMVSEGTFLTDFVQEMRDFCDQRKGGPDVSDLFPRVYYKDTDIIIQEDLSKRGFTIMPKEIKRTFDEAKLVFEHLARLHAVSHVMIATSGGPTEFLKTHPFLVDTLKKPGLGQLMSQTMEPSLGHSVSLIKLSKYEDKQEKYKLIEKYQGKIFDTFLETIDAETLIHSVNHGDFWNNNMMLDTGTTNKKLILIDLQCPRVNSPNMDIMRFLFFSCAPDVRKRWKELLEYYFSILQEYVLALGHPFPFTFENFVKDFSRKGKMDFLISLALIFGVEAMANHASEDTNTEDFGGDFQRLLVIWTENNPEKVSMIGDLMVDMINDFLLFGDL